MWNSCLHPVLRSSRTLLSSVRSSHRPSLPPPLLSRSSLHHHLPLSRPLSRSSSPGRLMELREVLEVLEQLAPLALAEPWDNVGLLVEPSRPRPVRTLLLTTDLTEAVMEEAEAASCDLLVSYHPPLFRPIKRLVQKDWKQRLAVRALEGGMAVFSPHTSWDSVKGGVNDWLVGGLGSGRVSVLQQALSGDAPYRHKVEVMLRSSVDLSTVLQELKVVQGGALLHSSVTSTDGSERLLSVSCSDSALPPAVKTLLRHSDLEPSVLKLQQPPLPGHGQGRLLVLDQPVTVATAVDKMKRHLGLNHLRLALGVGRTMDSSVGSAAACAGSGASVLGGVRADLYITGEMSHHEVLDAVAMGTSVLLSDHSNSERGFLAVVRERLALRLPDTVTVMTSRADRDPLEVV